MTAIELRGSLAKLGWTQTELARRTETHVNTVSRWATGACAVPGSVAAYLRQSIKMKNYSQSMAIDVAKLEE